MKKLIVVTGGTKGIGRAIVMKFASQNFDIITCARTAHELNQLKLDVESNYPQIKIFTRQTDMSIKEEVKSFCAFINNLNRPVDILVNNAGYFIPGEIMNEPDGTLETMIDVHLYSAYYATRGLVGEMKTRKSGHIFNVCSIASLKAYPNGGSYAIAKTALLGFSRCLREELKNDGIRVTAVIPGATYTASWEGAGLPEERFMKVEDISESIYAAYALSGRSVVEELLIRPQLGDI